MFKSPIAAIIAASAITAPAAAASHDYSAGALKIGHPWSRPTPAGAPTAAGYLTITNAGPKADVLLGGSSSMASKVEVHQMSMAGGIMRMRPVPGGLPIPPHQTVSLAPGGYHLMLIGPQRPFKAGDHIPVILRFQRAGAVSVEFDVQASTPAGGQPMSMGMH
ncbi:MAG: copper chaperone PCu(A)C [Caulobacteraceae bacterium]|nr:copper chaperone PCu(A)C [Caulobacteraceae bacterium]